MVRVVEGNPNMVRMQSSARGKKLLAMWVVLWSLDAVCAAACVAGRRSGACFVSNTCSTSAAAAAAAPAPRKPALSSFKPHVPVGGGTVAGRPAGAGGPSGSGRAAAAAGVLPTGLHDPHAPGAVVLNTVQWKGGSGKLRDGRPVTPVTVDP